MSMSVPIHTFFQFSILIILFLTGAVQGSIQFSNIYGNVTLTFPTVDYFQSHASEATARQGCLLLQAMPIMDQGAGNCRFDQPRPLFPRSSRRYPCSAVLVDTMAVLAAGCLSIVDAVTSIERDMLPYLGQAQLPTSNPALVFMLPEFPQEDQVSVPGGPITTPYLPRRFSVKDSLPKTSVVLMDGKYARMFAERFQMVREVVTSITPEQGAWNVAFLSGGYIGFQWTLFTLNTIMVMIALVQFSMALRSRTVVVDKRLIIFASGVVSTVVFSVALTQRKSTRAYVLCDGVSSLMFALAFYQLLLLWSAVLAQVKRQCGFRPLRLVIFAAMFIAVYNLVITLVWLGVPSGPVVDGFFFSAKVGASASQIAVALLFLYYAIRFQFRKNATSSEHTQRALSRICWLALFGFLTFIAKGIANLLAGTPQLRANVGAVMACYVIVDLCGFLRAFSILLVLGVRLPPSRGIVTTANSNANSQQTKSFGSSTGTVVSQRRDTATTTVFKPMPVLHKTIKTQSRTTQLVPALYGEPLKSPGNVTRMSLRPQWLEANNKRVSHFGWLLDDGLVHVDSDYDDDVLFDDELRSINSSQSPSSWRL